MIKTFPLRFDADTHKKIKEAAHTADKSIHQYILDAIFKQIKKDMEAK